MTKHDVLIIGGGIVGLATAYGLVRRYPDKSLVILEKEAALGQHQTGHNSGVLHSGIYYKPGSLKAINCREGKQRMEEFCTEQGIPFDICGKVIVAVKEDEVPALERIYERGQANGVRCEVVGPERLAELEPHCPGVKAIHVPETGIVDFKQVAARLGQIVAEHGGQIVTAARVRGMRTESDKVIVESTQGDFSATHVVNCTGLYSDRVTRLSGQDPARKSSPSAASSSN